MKHYLIALCFASCACVAFSQNDGSRNDSPATLIFNDNDVVVDPNQMLRLDCGVEGKFRSCVWEQKGEEDRTLQIEDVRDGYHPGISVADSLDNADKCTIIIDSVSTSDNGGWTCKVFAFGRSPEATKQVLVTVRPALPKLDVYESPLIIYENVERTITCSVPAARPAADIRWFIDDQDVTSRSQVDKYPIDHQGTYSSNSTLYYTFTHTNDGNKLRCSVTHRTLEEPEIAEVSLGIKFQPYPLSPLEIYGIPMGNEYEIKYNFTANPEPNLIWFIGNERVNVPGRSGRYMAMMQQLNESVYMATLKISEFTNDDISVSYRLNAINELGERNFEISLSTGPAPPDGDYGMTEYISPPENKDSKESVETGTLVAIIVVVVFLVVILLLIGVMKYRQMFCFGSKDKIKNHMKDTEDLKEEHSETESSAAPREPVNSKKATTILKNIRSKFPPMPSRKGQKETRVDKLEEGESQERVEEDAAEEKGKTNPETVYTELDHSNTDRKADKRLVINESTEYAEIVGTVPDNKRREQRE